MTDPGFTVEVVPHTCHSCVVCGAKTPVASPDQVRLEDVWRAWADEQNPPEGECECGLPMDSHAGGMGLLHHDTFLIQAVAARSRAE
jgi:hypothetical protein